MFTTRYIIRQAAHTLRHAGLALAVLMSLPAQAIDIKGNVYGGGKEGQVGTPKDSANVVVDILGTTINDVFGGGLDGAVYGTTTVNFNDSKASNIYGGGSNALVDGTCNVNLNSGFVLDNIYGGGRLGRTVNTNVTMAGGYVGYTNATTRHKSNQNGNIFGGGFGESAVALNTRITVDGGTVGNSLYGGGEIASIGEAKVIANGRQRTLSTNADDINLRMPGQTSVILNAGLVEGNVFGGGRGFSFDEDSIMQLGETLHADGFVFGRTSVEICGGTVGTAATLKSGEGGSIFGGGNMGYVFSLDGTKADDGFYYNNGKLTEDCRVVIKSDGEKEVRILNAVYAGGNVAQGSDLVYANTYTVFGNVTATILDAKASEKVYIGRDSVGGLYGDGNLTLVDGYRELNVTNYGNTITSGRVLNTIQRAEYCGLNNSRLILKGARDRVTDVADFTDYTFNRVGELSLNNSSYAGIYNVVNLLGGMTSDVDFYDAVRTAGADAADGSTYREWKEERATADNRNDATSTNGIGMASGVWLEILKAKNGEDKTWGPVTGVIQLDLIDVATGDGGGFVYAKNIHGTRTSNQPAELLAKANDGLVSNRLFTYDTDDNDYETSGNFVNVMNTRFIVDDCYPDKTSHTSPAHMWYVKGAKYEYNQLISAYTGASQAFSDQLSVPFANMGGQLELVSVESTLADEDGTNLMDHAHGFLLTLDWNNPTAWKKNDSPAPSFLFTGTTSVFGQIDYTVGDLIDERTRTAYNNLVTQAGSSMPGGQAEFERSYVAKEDTYAKVAEDTYKWITVGSVLSQTEYNLNDAATKALFEPGMRCIGSLFIDENTQYLYNEVIPESAVNSLSEDDQDYFSTSYVCTAAGKYEGHLYEKNKSYNALDWNILSDTERSYFTFNKDAHDLLTKDNASVYTTAATTALTPSPVETATVYVARGTDITKLETDRIVTVTYKYTKAGEPDETHVINIRVHFESGAPVVGDLVDPRIVLPGTPVGIAPPYIIPGAYEILGGGWEIYTNEADALHHSNGSDYSRTPLYWYQDGSWIAYYVKSYVGRTYSAPVELKVANYHRMEKVFTDANHLYVDKIYDEKRNKLMKRPSKIYIDDRQCKDASMNELDYFHQFFDSLMVAGNEGVGLNADVRNGNYMEFILQSDVTPDKYADWTPVGQEGNCFESDFHGDGYTVYGLNNSLFGKLCGNVWNLGVTGTFTGSGVAQDGGSATNCWVYTTGTTAAGAEAIGTTTVVNSYYYNGQYNDLKATAMPARRFIDGTVAYSLNSFAGQDYDADGYVEKRYADGDFIYAGGTTPRTDDFRYDTVSCSYLPVADDYLFFGQKLTYDLIDGYAHHAQPEHLIKTGYVDNVTRNDVEYRRTFLIDGSENGNRVFRAPAYDLTTGSALIRGVHYNRDAAFSAFYEWNGVNYDIDSRLTAIDFTGHNDNAGWLDFDGLNSFTQNGITKNLLVYAGTSEKAVLSAALPEPAFATGTYNTVAVASDSNIKGHLVTLSSGSYTATSHKLVDKQNFQCPIAFTYADGSWMWYQRTPERYAMGTDKEGFESIVLPFTADLVTTQDKGEITHFYGDDFFGHEYWLRSFKGIDTENEQAVFERPAQGTETNSVDNTFLYDYYYSQSNDANNDKYFDFYSDSRDYTGYTYLTENVPYAIAFPGKKYYEFDLSGQFAAKYTKNQPKVLDTQVVTFVSKDNQTIGVTAPYQMATSASGYTYYGSFADTVLTHFNGSAYRIDDAGHGFEADASLQAVPFRAFLAQTSSHAQTRGIFDYLPFSSDAAYSQSDDDQEPVREYSGLIHIWSTRGVIHVESNTENDTFVTVYSADGQLISSFNLTPGQHKRIPVSVKGIYIVNHHKIAL